VSNPGDARERERTIALAWLFSTSLIWGAAFTFTRAGMVATSDALERAAPGTGASALGPTLFLVLRFGLAIPLGCALPGAVRALRTAGAWRDSLLVGVPNFVGFMLQNYGIVETSATLSAFLTSLYVILVPAIVTVARRERPPARLVGGALVTLAGITVLGAGGRGDVADGAAAGFGRGEWLSILCAFAFALQVYLLDAASRRTEPAALVLGTFVITFVAAALILVSLPAGRVALRPSSIAAVFADPEARLGLVYAAVLASVIAIYIMYRYQARMSPTRAAIIYAAEPAMAAMFAVAWGSERFQALTFVGCSLILIGNVVAELRRRPA
jgi:drug/metabolite transporter (DMT)-like permease